MTALDVLILWLTTGENYKKWRRGSCSKKDVGEIVSVYLAQNGHPGRSSAMCQYQVCPLCPFLSYTSLDLSPLFLPSISLHHPWYFYRWLLWLCPQRVLVVFVLIPNVSALFRSRNRRRSFEMRVIGCREPVKDCSRRIQAKGYWSKVSSV